MKIKITKRILKLASFFVICIFFFLCNLNALAWTVAPVRFEVKCEKGKEYTLKFSVLNESQLYQKRFEVQLDDWTINKNNDFLRKAFNKDIENKYSSIPWIKVTPQQFVVPPGETKNIRFTITVPKDLDSDGDYSAGIFVGEKNIEKPPKGEKIIHIKQDTFIGVIVYVKIGEEKQKIVLKDLQVKTKPQGNNLTKATLVPVFENQGNVHARGNIKVRAEEINGKESKEINGGEVVVLREAEVGFPVDIPDSLKADSQWKFTVSADFGNNAPVLIGTKKYKVPSVKSPQEKKQETPVKKIEEKKV